MYVNEYSAADFCSYFVMRENRTIIELITYQSIKLLPDICILYQMTTRLGVI